MGGPPGDADNAVVETVDDVAVVHEEAVRDLAQPCARILIRDALRLLAPIAGDEHNRALDALHE